MTRIADMVLGYDGENPFNETQARNFSDEKVVKEFVPTSIFWSLFNDQHELLIGTRGCGKTFLLKMMRYSMLKTLVDKRAQEIIKSRRYIALYVPMNIEFIGYFTHRKTDNNEQVPFFQFSFNCLLAESLITELLSVLEEERDDLIRAKKNIQLAKTMCSIWFNGDNSAKTLFDLKVKVQALFYNSSIENVPDAVPPVFTKQVGSIIQCSMDVIKQICGFSNDPTWIICVDEAEFLKIDMQKCINTVFRSDTKRLVFKVATLPFYHRTYNTIDKNISVSIGHDFNFKCVDMSFDSDDFIRVSNYLCKSRISRLHVLSDVNSLEEFVGVIGHEDNIDYYRYEFGEGKATYSKIEEEILASLSPQRRRRFTGSNNQRKTYYDKFAPILFVRNMYLLSKKGNSIPGWFAGSSMIRKVSQGNPRRFIEIMNVLFESARKTKLTPKQQHSSLSEYSKISCSATKALEIYGPQASENLDQIASQLQSRVHGDEMIFSGNTFTLLLRENDLQANSEWIKLAIAYSRLIVDNNTLQNGLHVGIKFTISNAYSVKYWLPMRKGDYPKISLMTKEHYPYKVKRLKRDISLDDRQITMKFGINEDIHNDEN